MTAREIPPQARREETAVAVEDLFRTFSDDAIAEQWFVEQRWGEEPYCPHCGSYNVQISTRHPTMPYRCREKECRKFFSVRTASVMAGTKLGYQKWVIAIHLLIMSPMHFNSMKLHRDLCITQKSAWSLINRIRKAWTTINSGPIDEPEGEDEIDVRYRESNVHETDKHVADMATINKGISRA